MSRISCIFMLSVATAALAACSGVERLTGREPIVDMQGVDLASYQRDRQDCEAYADQVQVDRQVATGAVAGAAAGAVIGAVVGNSDTAKRGAGVGAVSGTLNGAARGLSERQMVIRNCLLGRGYHVLN